MSCKRFFAHRIVVGDGEMEKLRIEFMANGIKSACHLSFAIVQYVKKKSPQVKVTIPAISEKKLRDALFLHGCHIVKRHCSVIM